MKQLLDIFKPGHPNHIAPNPAIPIILIRDGERQDGLATRLAGFRYLYSRQARLMITVEASVTVDEESRPRLKTVCPVYGPGGFTDMPQCGQMSSLPYCDLRSASKGHRGRPHAPPWLCGPRRRDPLPLGRGPVGRGHSGIQRDRLSV